MLKHLFKLFSSLKLTVACLLLGCVLVFWGTLAQVHLGPYKAQNEFFRSVFVYWQPAGSDSTVPIFPGGYFIGTVLLINLLCAHVRYYQPGKRKIGIVLIHLGVVLLLLGQMLTDFLSQESNLHLRIGETRNYSEADRAFELAVLDTTGKDSDKVVAIPCSLLVRRSEVSDPGIPFTVRVKTFYANSLLAQQSQPGYAQVNTTAGLGSGMWWREVPRETGMNRIDMPSAIVEIVTNGSLLGTFLASGWVDQPQPFTFNHRSYELLLRQERFYLPFSLHLIDFRHDSIPAPTSPRISPAASGCKTWKTRGPRSADLHEQPASLRRRNLLSGKLRSRRPRQRAAGGPQSQLAHALSFRACWSPPDCSSSSSAT